MAEIKDSDSGKIKLLIQKVRALADKGEGGEKENAKRKLSELLEKYNIKKFEEKASKKRVFKLADFNDCKTIMTHCIIDTLKSAKIEGYKSKKEIYCKLTDEQYIDVCQKFNHYFPTFVRQRENFIKAFILKNDLGISDLTPIQDDNTENKEISEISEMMKGINDNKFKKNKLLLNEN